MMMLLFSRGGRVVVAVVVAFIPKWCIYFFPTLFKDVSLGFLSVFVDKVFFYGRVRANFFFLVKLQDS